jgi:hypothetical protein
MQWPLETMNAQEVFDTVARHLLTQNKTSAIGPDCMYRLGSLKCAAGCLIPDEAYDESFEDTTWYNLVCNGQVPEAHEALITYLQEVHDNYAPEYWEDALKELARSKDLEFNFDNFQAK